MNNEQIQLIVEQVLAKYSHSTSPLKLDSNEIPIAVSARHVHLKQEHVEQLFGKGYILTKKSPLSQPGQFASNEQVTIVGSKQALHGVRILGPARDLSQVEISATDARILGVQAPLRLSGNIAQSGTITLVGPQGSITLQEGCIVAQAHIHMSPLDAQHFAVKDGEKVNVQLHTARPTVLQNIQVRVSENYALEMHIDTDEGNAAFVDKRTKGTILKSLSSIPTALDEPPQRLTALATTELYTKRLLSEQDIAKHTTKKIVIAKKTIVTALAQDLARKKGIEIVRQ